MQWIIRVFEQKLNTIRILNKNLSLSKISFANALVEDIIEVNIGCLNMATVAEKSWQHVEIKSRIRSIWLSHKK